jgi:uncharacterized protein YecT (DUF1311 family)
MSLGKAALFTLVALTTTPLAAQTPSPTLAADRAQLVACLRQSGTVATSCIGLVAVACVRAASSDRRAAEHSCARREEAVWRERLGQATQTVTRTMDAGQRSKLASLQVAWEGYVAQKCAFYGASQREGLQLGRQAGCELREVATRALELERSRPQATPSRPQQQPRIFRGE